MNDITTRIEGQIGRITLTRPDALNALSHDMSLAIEAVLDAWAEDDRVKLLLIDAEGERAFCAGGDIAQMYQAGLAQDYDSPRNFWRDEYRMNAKMFLFPKPVISLMQGFVMGGGVGVGCHASHRVVCDNSLVAMPETGIGLIPDVGGTLLLARAPGRLGEYLGATGARMGPADAIHAGFADYFIPQEAWPDLIAELVETGDWEAVDRAAKPVYPGKLAALQPQIDSFFDGETLPDILRQLTQEDTAFTQDTLKQLNRVSPLSATCAVEMVHRSRSSDDIHKALELEYRFTHRAMEHGDFIEGVRAQIIDKDRNPTWKHAELTAVAPVEMSKMLMPLGADALKL